LLIQVNGSETIELQIKNAFSIYRQQTMMYWWDYGASPPWYSMFLGPLMMIVFLVVAALVIAWIIRASGAGWQSSWRRKSALDILQERFARGEIDRREYEERKQLLSGP
jgi:putative membrane protein